MYKLVIGNKAYSSWSLRPWILMKAFGLPFSEDLIPLDTPEFRAQVNAYGAGSTVPILVDGDVTVWESLAIMEYLADKHQDLDIWPADIKARALARTISCEIHAGFRALRNACPMNIRKRHPTRDRGADVARDVARLEHIWRTARMHFGGQGPFLFGAFSAADAMYAPVVTRLATYSIPVDVDTQEYMSAVLSHPAFLEWHAAAMEEPWTVDHDEADEAAIGAFPMPVC